MFLRLLIAVSASAHGNRGVVTFGKDCHRLVSQTWTFIANIGTVRCGGLMELSKNLNSNKDYIEKPI